jgi:hypothetical protein
LVTENRLVVLRYRPVFHGNSWHSWGSWSLIGGDRAKVRCSLSLRFFFTFEWGRPREFYILINWPVYTCASVGLMPSLGVTHSVGSAKEFIHLVNIWWSKRFFCFLLFQDIFL